MPWPNQGPCAPAPQKSKTSRHIKIGSRKEKEPDVHATHGTDDLMKIRISSANINSFNISFNTSLMRFWKSAVKYLFDTLSRHIPNHLFCNIIHLIYRICIYWPMQNWFWGFVALFVVLDGRTKTRNDAIFWVTVCSIKITIKCSERLCININQINKSKDKYWRFCFSCHFHVHGLVARAAVQ